MLIMAPSILWAKANKSIQIKGPVYDSVTLDISQSMHGVLSRRLDLLLVTPSCIDFYNYPRASKAWKFALSFLYHLKATHLKATPNRG
jgi:hypothetical protein